MGGVHPSGNKLTSQSPIKKLPAPSKVVVFLSQHIGAPAVPVVERGQEVKTGQLIAKAGGFVSANIHAPVSGKVTKIDTAADVNGYRKPAIYITASGDEWVDGVDLSDTLIEKCDLDAKEIINKIADAGIVGMGGACFPTHVKLSPPPGKKADILIVNAVECEPYLTADHRLLLEKGKEIVVGVKILMKAIGVDRAVIGIENNKPDAIENMEKLTAGISGVAVMSLAIKYPQGGEKQLIDAVTGKHVPSGALPVDAGAVVQNAATVFAVYEAVQKNKPLVERVITVTGKSVKEGGNFLVRLGTSMADVVEAAGGIPEDTAKIISGGPMMGKALVDIDVPMAKGSSGLLFISEKEASRKKIENCIRCGKCVDACPMGLEPYLFTILTRASEWDKLEENHIMDCIECGCCTFSCPSNRPLLDYLRLGKGTVGSIIRSRKK